MARSGPAVEVRAGGNGAAYLSAESVVCLDSSIRQKFSICHTFLGPPASAIASIRPFGDGNAPQISGLLDLSRTVALPSSVTLSKALTCSKLCQDTRSRFPSGTN